jgi:hypothetical protein
VIRLLGLLEFLIKNVVGRDDRDLVAKLGRLLGERVDVKSAVGRLAGEPA